MAIETPRYHLIKKSNRFELREYEPYLEAQVSVTASDHRAAASKGFGSLADFIFGNNTASHKISMTSPVSAQQTSERIAMTAPVTVSGSGEYTVAFSMPSRYSMASLP